MTEQKIVIEIEKDGSMKAKTDGFKGEACMKAIQELLGNDEVYCSMKPSDEFYQETKVVENTKIKTGEKR